MGSLVVAMGTAWGAWFGLEAEERAAHMIVEQVVEATDVSAERALRDAMTRVNEEFFAARPEVVEEVGPSCCAAAAVLDAVGTCTQAWVGSAMGVRRTADGRVQATRPHLLRDVFREKGIPKEQIEGHPNGLIVMRALGATETLDLDLVHWPNLQPGDRILLASQAVAEAFERDDAASLDELFKAADKLYEEIRHPRYRDRVAILIEVEA